MVVSGVGDLGVLGVCDIGYLGYIWEGKMWEVGLGNGSFIGLKGNRRGENLCGYDSGFVEIDEWYIMNMNYLVMVEGWECVMYGGFNNVDEVEVWKKYGKEMMEGFWEL